MAGRFCPASDAAKCSASRSDAKKNAELPGASIIHLHARDPKDGRGVLVSSTREGRAALDGLRREYQAVLRDQLAGHSDEDVLALAAATELIQEIIDALQRDVP